MDRREILKSAVDGLILAAAGSTVFATENLNQKTSVNDTLNIANAAQSVSMAQSTPGERVSVSDFGASPSAGAAANAMAFQAALNYAKSLRGARIHVPAGAYQLNAAIKVYANTTLYGDGWNVSELNFSHTGNGINSTWPINSSTSANINIKNLSISNTNALNAGGGFVDVGGSFVNVENCYIWGWKYGIIFDQTEVSTIDRCNIEQPVGGTGVWIVNGADHTSGADAGFTNRITITRNQFNAAVGGLSNILDDGGGAHSIRDNNFNAGSLALRACGVFALSFEGNECEGHTKHAAINLTFTTNAGTYVGPCSGITIKGNSFTDVQSCHISIDDASGGIISGNIFNQAKEESILFANGASNRASGVIIEGNSKVVMGKYKQAAPFVGAYPIARRANIIRQTGVTYNPASISSGSNTCAPATMESINIDTLLWCINQDGTNGEQIIVTSVTSTTFTATFSLAKKKDFCIYGLTPDIEVKR